MALKEIFTITKNTKIIFVIVVCITIISFAVAFFYYDYKNQAEDPRVIDARYKLAKYDGLIKDKKYLHALFLLDTIDDIYKRTTGYNKSFEHGVIYNNRGTVYLSMALYDSLISTGEKKNLFKLAELNINLSINIYQKWIDSVGTMTEEQIRKNIDNTFDESDTALKGKNIKRIIDKRIKNIKEAQIETPRRLSVSYTNLGIAQRHQLRQEEALKSYLEAIKLWKDNYTARNNFNVLMGKPPEDRSIIDQLFPPDRTKKDKP